MINTVIVKQEQLKFGSCKRGSGKKVILLIGSCRAINYFNYLIKWNDENGNMFTIHHLDPFNWNWNEKDEFINYEEKINSLESNDYILDLLESTDIYIHEYYENFGMFNTRNIYNFGLSPELDICIPNFNDLFILENDILRVDPNCEDIKEVGLKAIDKFYNICLKSDFPEMAEHFYRNWKTTRFFWTQNHITKNFSLFIFEKMNERFLNLSLSDKYIDEITKEVDMFAFPHTETTENDKLNHGIQW